VLISRADKVQDLKIFNFFQSWPIQFQLNRSTCTERVNSINDNEPDFGYSFYQSDSKFTSKRLTFSGIKQKRAVLDTLVGTNQ